MELTAEKKDELLQVIQATSAVTVTSEQIDKTMEEFDDNKDGKINYEEFVSKMMSIDTKQETQEDLENSI